MHNFISGVEGLASGPFVIFLAVLVAAWVVYDCWTSNQPRKTKKKD